MKATAQWTKEQNKEEAFKLSSVFNNISTFPQPVIAMINGPAYGKSISENIVFAMISYHIISYAVMKF